MKKYLKLGLKIVSMFVCVLFAASLFAGCSSKTENQTYAVSGIILDENQAPVEGVSVDGGEYKPAVNADLSGKPYVHLRNIAFTKLSIGSYSTPTTTSTALGASAHAFCIPEEALGKEKVSVRIRPYDTVMSALPSIFTGEIENSYVTEHSDISDNVSFQDIFIRYR